MRLQVYTHEDLFALAKAIVRQVTGVDYPFGPRTYHRAVATVQSMLGANASIEGLRSVKANSIDGLSGMLLDRRALDNNTERTKPSPARIQGRFIPTNPGGAGAAIPIQPNTVIVRPATATQSEIAFKTEAMAIIQAPGGVIDASSNLIHVLCTEFGEKGNGIASGSQLSLRTAKNGVAHFLTTTASAGGAERGDDPDLRTAARDAKKGHAECTWAGIENLLTTVKMSSGHKVMTAKLIEAFDEPSPFYTGVVYAIIDDGSGDDALIGPIDTTTYGPYDAFAANPYWEKQITQTTVYVQLPKYPVGGASWSDIWDDGVNAGINYFNGTVWALLTEGTDFFVDSDRGKIAFTTPLVAGETIRVQWPFYTDLVGEAATYLNGVLGSSEKKGWRPVGTSIRVRPPQNLSQPTVSATMVFKPNYDSTFGRSVGGTAVVAYLDSIRIGDPARWAVLNGILHRVPGLDYVEDLLLDSGTVDVSPSNKFSVVRSGGTLSL